MTPEQVRKVFEIKQIQSPDLQRIHEIVHRINPVKNTHSGKEKN